MKKEKINSMILMALILNSLSLSIYAYRFFAKGQTGYGVVFTSLVVLFLIMFVSGIVRNHKVKQEAKLQENEKGEET